MEQLLTEMMATVIYAVLGTVIFLAVIWVIETVTHFSIKKEIVEDGNIAVAIVLAAMVVSLAMIISAAMH